jgi:hypothetical protein
MADAEVQEMVKWAREWIWSFQSRQELISAIKTVLGEQVRAVWVTVRWRVAVVGD